MLDAKEQRAINKALKILESHFSATEYKVDSPSASASYLKLKLSLCEREVFAVMFLNNQHELIEYQELFFGTIDSSVVYPREIIKEALRLNSSALVLAHNHPSGNVLPSEADKRLTNRVVEACRAVDLRVLDHIIVGKSNHYSFAEFGLI